MRAFAENKRTISFAGVDANIVIFIVIVLGVNGALQWFLKVHVLMKSGEMATKKLALPSKEFI